MYWKILINGEITDDGQIAKDVLEGTVTSVCGIQSLQMGVFGGIIVGLGVASLHNRFHKIVLPNAPSITSPILDTEVEDNQRIRLLANGEIKAGEPLFAVETLE